MADSEEQKVPTEEQKMIHECRSKWNDLKSALSAKIIGELLKYLLHIIAAFHAIPALICAVFIFCIWGTSAGTMTIFLAFVAVSNVVIPITVIELINLSSYYEEIQSWQIAYIAWGVACGMGWSAYAVLIYMQTEHAEAKLSKMLLLPFGVKSSKAVGVTAWAIPLVSMAAGIFSGFVANFFWRKSMCFYATRRTNNPMYVLMTFAVSR